MGEYVAAPGYSPFYPPSLSPPELLCPLKHLRCTWHGSHMVCQDFYVFLASCSGILMTCSRIGEKTRVLDCYKVLAANHKPPNFIMLCFCMTYFCCPHVGSRRPFGVSIIPFQKALTFVSSHASIPCLFRLYWGLVLEVRPFHTGAFLIQNPMSFKTEANTVQEFGGINDMGRQVLKHYPTASVSTSPRYYMLAFLCLHCLLML